MIALSFGRKPKKLELEKSKLIPSVNTKLEQSIGSPLIFVNSINSKSDLENCPSGSSISVLSEGR